MVTTASRNGPTQCYVDESVHADAGFVVTAFVFTRGRFSAAVAKVLSAASLVPHKDEFKSSARMDSSPKMQVARQSLLALADSGAAVAVFVGPHDRSTLGKHSLQALQSTVVRNGIRTSQLEVYFDRDIFRSAKEARRLHRLFHGLRSCTVFPQEDSRLCLGIQVADAVAHSFGQIFKEHVTGKAKLVDVGGPGTGYENGTMVPLGWKLLMTLRHGLLTRPMAYDGNSYQVATDPVVLDPLYDDPAVYGQHPILLGWGVQIAPEAPVELQQPIAKALSRIWLGCIH